MSIASDILAEGDAALLHISGEEVTFRGAPVMVLIDRSPPPETLERGEIDMIASEASEVWVPWRSVRPPPRKGESFLDQFGRYHAVRAQRFDGGVYKCACEVNERQ